MTWRIDIETIEAKAFRTFLRIYSLLKSERLNANIKLTLHVAFIRLIITYACRAWEFAVDTHRFKLQRLQNKVLPSIGKFPRRAPIRDLHVALKIPYVCDFITKLCRQQTEVIQSHQNQNGSNIVQGKAQNWDKNRLLTNNRPADRPSIVKCWLGPRPDRDMWVPRAR
jgi:hypothetical protein